MEQIMNIWIMYTIQRNGISIIPFLFTYIIYTPWIKDGHFDKKDKYLYWYIQFRLHKIVINGRKKETEEKNSILENPI
jgi:hypothetical protein